MKSRRETNKTISDANNSIESREDYLDAISGCLEVLQQNLATLEDATPAIQRKIKKEKSTKIWIVIGVILTALFGTISLLKK